MKLFDILTEEDIALHEEEMNLWEMANLSPQKTGLPLIVWVSSGEGARHGARIKVCSSKRWDNNQCSTIPLFGPARIIGNADVSQDTFSQIVRWIELNRDILLQYWNSEITTDEMFDQLKTLEN